MFYEPVWEYEGFTLVERPDSPNYFIYWRPAGSGRAVRESTRTRDLDRAKRMLVEYARQRLKPTKRSSERVPLLETLCDYVEQKTASPKPFRPASLTVVKHLSAFIEIDSVEYVADFGLDAQRRYIDWRRRTLLAQGFTASNATFNRELGVVKAALRSSWKRGLIDSVPHVEMLPNPPPRDRFLRVHEVRRLLSECHLPHLKLYVMLALHTAQRPIGIFSLRVEQVDLDWGRIDFLPSGVIQSNKRRPVVPITPSLRPYLEEAIAHSESGYVLEKDGRPVQSVKKAFRAACERAGIENCTPYTLRHTGATLMAAAGVPLRQIAGMLGHSEQRTTEIYAKHHPDFLLDAARAIETLFGTTISRLPQPPKGPSPV
jgi:integrase